uniref:Uncharacterized protein n=1 Tax=Caenorhabditis tropicalis TaxID=1561998 RepID=A0A1I7TAN7_9PELO
MAEVAQNLRLCSTYRTQDLKGLCQTFLGVWQTRWSSTLYPVVTTHPLPPTPYPIPYTTTLNPPPTPHLLLP